MYSAKSIFNLLVRFNYFLEVTMKRALFMLGSLFLAGVLYAAGDADAAAPAAGETDVNWETVNDVLKEIADGVIKKDPLVKQFKLWVDERDSSFEKDYYRVSFEADLANLPWQDANRESSFRVTLKAHMREYQNKQNAKDTKVLGELDIGVVLRTDGLAFVKHIVTQGVKLAEAEVKEDSAQVEDQVVLAVKDELAKVKDVKNFAELAEYLKGVKIAFLEALRSATLSDSSSRKRLRQLNTLAEITSFLNGITMEEFDTGARKLTLNLERAIASIPDTSFRHLSNTNVVLQANAVTITARLTTADKKLLDQYRAVKPEAKSYVLGLHNRDPLDIKALTGALQSYYGFARMWVGVVADSGDSDGQ